MSIPQETGPRGAAANHYPGSDGQPMGGTGFHVIGILHLYTVLHAYCRRQTIYVGADMFLYYGEGDPRAVKAPDVMVIKGVAKHIRRTFKVWEENATPCVIFEITSASTLDEDEGPKM